MERRILQRFLALTVLVIVCNDICTMDPDGSSPYPSVGNAARRELDFFVFLGDTSYADYPSDAVPQQAETIPEFRAKHDEVYSS